MSNTIACLAPESRARLLELATLCVVLPYDTIPQEAADAEFVGMVRPLLTKEQRRSWEAYSLKATTSESVHFVLDLLDLEMPVTLAHFRATRRHVADLSTDEHVGGGCSDLPGYVYADRFFIEIEGDGSFYLPIANTELKGGPHDLERLEVALFTYAQRDGLDAAECHEVCERLGVACPVSCAICGGAS